MPGNEFYILFDTQSVPGKVEAVKVTIEKVEMTDMYQPGKLALRDHPLYPDLKAYVEANR